MQAHWAAWDGFRCPRERVAVGINIQFPVRCLQPRYAGSRVGQVFGM
jgi:hypothetical protein